MARTLIPGVVEFYHTWLCEDCAKDGKPESIFQDYKNSHPEECSSCGKLEDALYYDFGRRTFFVTSFDSRWPPACFEFLREGWLTRGAGHEIPAC